VPETRRQFTAEFREGAVRIVRETGRPIAQVARELGINAGTLGNWVVKDRAGRGDRPGHCCTESSPVILTGDLPVRGHSRARGGGFYGLERSGGVSRTGPASG